MNPRAEIPSAEELLDHASWIRSLARGLTADSDGAEDLVQRTWIAAWENRERRRGPLRSWLAAILHNFARQDRRSEGARARRERSVARLEALPSGDELLERLEQQRLLVDLVGKLSETQRTVILLHYFEGLAIAEIAARLGEKPATVRQRLKRGHDALREELDGRFGGRQAWLSALAPLTSFSSAVPTGVLLGSAFVLKKSIVIAAALIVIVGGTLYLNSELKEEASSPALELAANSQRAETTKSPSVGAVESEEFASVSPERRAASLGVVPADQLWTIQGQVEWPFGYEVGDHGLEVFAVERELSYRQFVEDDAAGLLARAPVAEDGGFTLELPEERSEVHLMLRGRYLYLESTVECVQSPSMEPMRLAASAGCWIHGVLATPTDRAGSDLSGIPLRLASELTFEDPGGARTFRFTTESDEEGRFEFRAMPPSEGSTLLVTPEALAAAVMPLGETLALEDRELRVGLLPGGAVEGRVIDEAGEPVAGAEVRGILRGKLFGFDDDEVRRTVTDGGGDFRLEALPPGGVHVIADSEDYLESEKLPVNVTDRQSNRGHLITLTQGRALGGVVRFADGSPAAGARVEATFDKNFNMGPAAFNRLRGAKGSARADEAGSFRIAGLGPGPFVVTAALEIGGGEQSTRFDAVKGGADDLELILYPPLSIRGSVVDGAGRALEQFEVHASRLSEGAVGEMESGAAHQSFREASGVFELGGLLPGRWQVVVTAEGMAPSQRELYLLPESGPSRVFVLEVPATISGTVVTPDGLGVAGAVVELDTGLSEIQAMVAGGLASPSATTDELGFFHLRGLRAGTLRVRAKAAGFTWSESLSFELESGEQMESVRLVLRLGGRISGEAYADGEPAVGRMVNLVQWGQGAFDTRMTETDDRGSFVLEHVDPGNWNLLVIDTRGGSGSADGEPAVHNLFGSMLSTQVEVTEGSDQHVVLGTAPRDPVRVYGRVLRGGEPFGGAALTFQRAEEGASSESVLVSVDREGRYTAIVDGAGTYVVMLTSMAAEAGAISSLSFNCEIPGDSEHHLDFELPDGGISGRVFDADGDPLANARVTLMPSPDADLEQHFAPRFIEAFSDAQGRFELDGLSGGSYTIMAGGGGGQGAEANEVRARVARDGLVVDEDRWLRGVEITLPQPGSLRIEALDDLGAAVNGAGIFVRDASGRVLEAIPYRTTDPAGAATYPGLAPGTYSVFARTLELASPEVEVVVRSGEMAEAKLALEQGAWIQLRTLDRAGDAQGSVVSVLDEEGREVGGVFHDMSQAMERLFGMASGEHRVGPLLPGSYRLGVSTRSGAKANKRVRLKDGDARKVTARPK